MKSNNKINYIWLSIFALSIATFGACKKYNNPAAIYEELKINTSKQRKVLIIGIDGLGGAELQAIAPTNFTALQKNSKYSFATQKGVSDAGGWASILTGTIFAKHQILADNFERYINPNGDNHGVITSYRNVLDYITQFKAVKTGLVSPWSSLRKYLSNADFAPIVNSDAAVKDSTVAMLTNQTGLGTLVVNFRDVIAAGANGGYTATNAAYKAAVNTTDDYVGAILTALKARKNYANEDWLVILTSNHGGSSANPTAGFMLAYYPSLIPNELKKNGFSTINFKSNNIFAVVPDDNGLYNMSDNKDFTVQMDVKMNNVSSTYPKILGKSNNSDDANFTGWYWMQENAQWNLEFGGKKNGGGGKLQLGIGGTLTSNWTTLTMTVKYVNATTRTASAYVNGVFKNSYNVSGSKSINTTDPLRLGGNYSTTPDFYAANLQIFDIALDNATITSNMGLKDISKHTKYANLIGFWPIDEGTGGVIQSGIPGGYAMFLSGVYSWTSLGVNVPAGTIADPNYVAGAKTYVSTLGDVTALSLYWMKIKILAEYNIDGNPFLNQYELEFLK